MQNRSISVIPARAQNRVTESGKVKAKLSVAAYCRVSTDDEEQLTSYEAQVSHYSSHIQQNPEWEFAGIYADEALSGTNTRKRTDFNRLVEDCMAGKVDYIITKSVSRFARKDKKSIVWRCVSRLEEKGSDCTSPTILESDLQNGVLKAINQIITERDEFIGIVMNNIAAVLGEEFDKDTDAVDL